MTHPAAPSSLDFKNLLNPSQYQAASHTGGPLLIVAGAGSGKTRTIVHRVAWLVDQGYPPSSILLLTFTRKAAREMLSRCVSLVGVRANQVSGGTFHSLANLLLRKQAHHLGFSHNFSIIDQYDSESIIGRFRTNDSHITDLSHFPKKSTILGIISQSINKDIPLSQLIKSIHPHLANYSSIIIKIAENYSKYKLENNMMDFDDLLINLEKLLKHHEHIRQDIASKFTHILVDEYQDTNPIQARITYLLGKDHLNITAVGDEAQSIYSFRGATFRNIMDFPQIFAGTTILKLEDNYRSHPEILTLANHLLNQAKEKYEKTLRATRDNGLKPTLIITDDYQSEANLVFERIRALIKKGVKLRDIAVLFRAGSHSFELEAELTRNRIPYTKFGGRKFLEMAHIKDFLSLLRLSINPHDELSLRRILALFPGLGSKGVEKIVIWTKEQPNYPAKLHRLPVSSKTQPYMLNFADLMEALSDSTLSAAEKSNLTCNFYIPFLPNLYPDDYPSRHSDLTELHSMIVSCDSLSDFIADLTLDPPNNLSIGESEKIPEPGQTADSTNQTLTLSTVHSAKGLEWDYVFVLSAVDGRFPSAYCLKNAQDVEEELRLMYVAVTRAREELTITIPMQIGQFSQESPTTSRFLLGLKSEQTLILKGDQEVDSEALMSSGFGFSDYSYYSGPFNFPKKTARPLQLNTSPSSPLAVSKYSPPDLHSGQRVNHPIFGEGKVLKVVESRATINFDLFGQKNVMIQHSKLTVISG